MKKNLLLVTIILTICMLFFSQQMFAAGQISGNVHYSGEKVGPVVVAAINFQLDFNNLFILDTLETGPGEFSFDGLAAGQYIVAAFMDANGDGIPGLSEPLGAYSGTLQLTEDGVFDSVDVYLNELSRGAGAISGNVTYDGSLTTGKIQIYALGLSGTPFNNVSTEISGGYYSLTGLMDGEYIVVAYLDANDNELPELGEPIGFIVDRVVVSNSEETTGNDLSLSDRQSFTSSISGTLTYDITTPDTIYIYTVGLSQTPISCTQVIIPNVDYEVTDLAPGDYYMFAFIDTNASNMFDPAMIDISDFANSSLAEPYELIAEPIELAEGENKVQNLLFAPTGHSQISGKVTYDGENRSFLHLVAAIGLSPSWLGLTTAMGGNYNISGLDAGYYAVISYMPSSLSNLSLEAPLGFYTKGLVQLASDDTVSGIDFILQDSTTSTSSIVGTITAPEGDEGDIHLFSLGISLTPYQNQIISGDNTYVIPDLRMGRYLVGAFMDTNNNGSFDLNEPFDITESLVEIPTGDLEEVVDLQLTYRSITSLPEHAQNFQPDEFVLGENYPNPFNPTTNFQYQLADSRNITIKVYNMLGNEVRTLVNGKQDAGLHTVSWDGKNNVGINVTSGVYIYSLRAGNFIDFKKMTLVR